MNTIMSTSLNLPGQISKYRGKVRDVYYLENNIIIIISTDRLSAFDIIMPKGIPYKGLILNQIAARMINSTNDLVPNWVYDSPDPNVTIGVACKPFKVEMVIRGYLSGHAAREYKIGKREISGVSMPEGMNENDRFPHPIITPSTKAESGHDQDISKEEIISKEIVSESDYLMLERYTYDLFKRGSKIAQKQGLILVDTKYEFGISPDGSILLIDEIHTPDSSRYFYLNGYKERQERGEPQKQLSKEFVRQWLISKSFQGLENQKIPDMNVAQIESISNRYIELYEKILGESFVRQKSNSIEKRIENNILNYLKSI
ncbi:MAG: phosphoribosylaminoimidazolesuccinocarboxamide synthase [Flavobacteriaceae bacterium]|nr:phosphoribosylaminoimidazolesuccinocarboxamide synthase [Flavobacteriaceae bacterium]